MVLIPRVQVDTRCDSMAIVPSRGPSFIVSAITKSRVMSKHAPETPRRYATVSGVQLEWMPCNALQRWSSTSAGSIPIIFQTGWPGQFEAPEALSRDTQRYDDGT